MTSIPKMHKIVKVVKESEHHTTLFFEGKVKFKAGQFVMLWLPELDEKPFTVSYHGEDEFGVTIEAKGKFTKKIVNMKPGEMVGVRGAFGNGFTISDEKKVCVVAGGCGMAPVSPLIDELLRAGKEIVIIQGARNENSLLFSKRFKKVKFCTDDGSKGHHGFVTDVLRKELEKGEIDRVYSCGPEIMMVNVIKVCDEFKTRCDVSLERYMRCGFGICGACTCGNQRVCIDGPVFSSKKVKKMKHFGKSAQVKSGHEVPLNDYFSWRCK